MMVNERSGRVWQIVAAFAAIAAVVVAIVLFIISQKGELRQLKAVVLSEATLINENIESTSRDLKISYKGKEITNISIIQVRIINSGSKPIRSEDIEKSITLSIEGTEELISAEIINPRPTNLPISASIKGISVELSKCLLNPGDNFIVEISLVKGSKIVPHVNEVTGRIAGIKAIDLENSLLPISKKTDLTSSLIVGAIAGLLSIPISLISLLIFIKINSVWPSQSK